MLRPMTTDECLDIAARWENLGVLNATVDPDSQRHAEGCAAKWFADALTAEADPDHPDLHRVLLVP